MYSDFLDPDADKKRNYRKFLKAIKKQNSVRRITSKELIYVSKFFERQQLNRLLLSNPNRLRILNLVGWFRMLFRIKEYTEVMKDLDGLGICLDISQQDERKIKKEFKRRNRSKIEIKNSGKKPKFELTIVKRRSINR